MKHLAPREAITEVAVKLFSEHGYTGTTMRDIAKAVGVLPGSLYAHIDSKDALLLEIVSGGIAQFLAVEEKIAEAGSTACARLRAAIRWHVDVVAEDPERTLVVFHQWRFLEEPNRSTAVAMRGRYADAFTRIVEQGKASGEFSSKLDTRVTVFGILGALNWVPEWYSSKGPMAAPEIAERLADTLILGLGNSPVWTHAATDTPRPQKAAPAPATTRLAGPRSRSRA